MCLCIVELLHTKPQTLTESCILKFTDSEKQQQLFIFSRQRDINISQDILSKVCILSKQFKFADQ